MSIAVIGWGSLIWCPGSLRIKSRWRPDGPMLPLEFARISTDGRLTLVIHPGSPAVRTYWALSECETMDEARQNLCAREGTALSHIAMAIGNAKEAVANSDGKLAVLAWLQSRPDIDAAVWTALSSNWEAKRRRVFSPEDAARYLADLERERGQDPLKYRRACEYIRNAPAQIQTRVRQLLQIRRDFSDTTLSPVLFDPDSNDCR